MVRILSISLFREIIWLMSQGIWFALSFSWAICDTIVEMRQEFAPSSLTAAKLFGWHEILEVLVICDYFDWSWWAFELRASFFEGADDDHEFLIVDFIVTFSRAMFLEKVCDRVKYIILIILWENSFRHIVWGISFHHKLEIWIVVTENNIRCDVTDDVVVMKIVQSFNELYQCSFNYSTWFNELLITCRLE